jgi:hypothetical protein
MASTHLFALKKKHETLNDKIREEYQHPAGNDFEIRRMKEERLHLREQIERLEGNYVSQ